MTAPESTRTSGHESSDERIDTNTSARLPDPPEPDGDWHVFATDATGEFDGQFAEAAVDSLRGDPTGRAETFPIRRDALVPVCFYAEDTDGTTFSVMLDLEPEQAERLASMLVEQATAAREQREEQADE